MKKRISILIVTLLIATSALSVSGIINIVSDNKNTSDDVYYGQQNNDRESNLLTRIKLPRPKYTSDTSIEKAMLKRDSVREYTGENLTIQEISQLLWAAQGITTLTGSRTAPSAGALYPLEVYLVVGDVEGLAKGIYQYKPHWHGLIKTLDGDIRDDLAHAALEQESVKLGAIDIVIAAVYERTTQKYGERGIGYTYMEAGHAAQNVYLQAEALELGTVVVGAFIDDRVKDVVGLKEEETPLYILPVGKK